MDLAARQHGFPFRLADFETLNYEAYECVACGSLDRERLLWLGLEHFGLAPSHRILEVGPSPILSGKIRAELGNRFRTCDLYSPIADDLVAVENIPVFYGLNRFDFVICSHVLEHVRDDVLALKAIHDVLLPGGRALILAPVCVAFQGLVECEETDPPHIRWRKAGQGDHLRLYGKGALERNLAMAGLDVEILPAKRVFSRPPEFGISEASILYVGRRPT